MAYKTELDLEIPNPKDLCCLNCQVNLADVHYSAIPSEFHCQTLACRILIHSEKYCIATPSIDGSSTFHVIINKRFYSTGLMQERLCSMKIKFSEPEYARSEVYEACLKFSFTFKITPFWNRIGQSYYLNGLNFLSSLCHVDAIRWKISVIGLRAKLELQPIKMNLFSLNFNYLGLPLHEVHKFKTSSNNTMDLINLTSHHCSLVYVLPNLIKARVVSVSKKLPTNSIFDSYKDLQLHWKNMYSYQLPEKESEMLFYEVVFLKHPNKRFIYPEICIFSKKPEIYDHDDKNTICLKFMNDLYDNVKSVCGEKLKIHPTLCRDNEQVGIEKTPNNTSNLGLSKFEQLTKRNGKKIIVDSQQDFVDYSNDVNQTSYIIDINDINSFYDIPTMYPNFPNYIDERKNSAMEMKEDSQSFVSLNSTLDNEDVHSLKAIEQNQEISHLPKVSQKPKIKRVENVYFNLTNVKKNTNTSKFKKSIFQQQNECFDSQILNGDKKSAYYMPPSTFDTIKKAQDDNYLIDFQIKPFNTFSYENTQYRERVSRHRSRSPLSLDSSDFNEMKKLFQEVEKKNESSEKSEDDAESCNLLPRLFSNFTTYDTYQNDSNDYVKNINDQEERDYKGFPLSHNTQDKNENLKTYVPLLKTKLNCDDDENENSFIFDDSFKLSSFGTLDDEILKEELSYSPDKLIY